MSFTNQEKHLIPEKYEPEKEARPSGFTLTETICSLFLLGTMMVFVVTTFRLVDLQQSKTDLHEMALVEVTNIMERLTAEKWENLTPELAEKTGISSSSEKMLLEPTLKTTITEDENSPGSRKIFVSLSYKTMSGQSGPPVQLTSWVYQQEQAE